MTVTSYIDSLVSVLRGAPDRTVLRSAGTGTTGAELLAATYRYARALDARAWAAVTWSPCSRRTAPKRWPSATRRT